jgi:hypothetical protein
MLMVLVACAACGESAAPSGSAAVDLGHDGATAPDLAALPSIMLSCSGNQPAFSASVYPILQSCGGCHGFSTSAASYAYLAQPTTECPGSRLRVAPGDPAHSYLIDKLTNRDICAGAPMPMASASGWHPLPTADLQTVYDWICAGAKNN